MWKIAELPRKLLNSPNWFASLITNDGVLIRVEIAEKAGYERARIITQQMAGIITHSEEP